MTYKLQLTQSFIKRYRALQKNNRQAVDAKLVLLAKNPWHPSLRLKKIQTTELFEASVNKNIRIALAFEKNALIVLLDIDHHDKLLRRASQ